MRIERILAVLQLDGNTVFNRSNAGQYIDMKCTHHTPIKPKSEAFNLRILLEVNKPFTIQVHWDTGVIENTFKDLNIAMTY